MIVLYRQKGSAPGAALELALRDLVVAHEVAEATPDALPEGIPHLPAIVDGDRLVYGEALPGYLAELERELTEWRKYQVDACYVDDEGEVC